ncbi:hypothetical protein P168DRAFT_293005 [Aspergillus campestris IBT 28561]|uniref:ATPase inhibitor, mitochondrial n=1 Tax=Aspergillus campestris (strain IBT 28561) TaxID=1392248 RepID=A0A2I1CU45_ASPC2|nr:uncharacterized protein P168DRAFT_293005 [Aspergillus campestris IBT 28561]PKY01153.1 hypothetical protein P168DRAFT_293005 [Aspergillus campestris IBT 28561]
MAYPKPRGFLAEKGPFTHRDAAHEGKFARNQEAEQMRVLRQRLSEQRGRIDELENYMSQSRIR